MWKTIDENSKKCFSELISTFTHISNLMLMNFVEIIGYIAMALVAISLMMKNIFWLRLINMIGAIVFVVYGFMADAYPVVGLNAFLTVVNLYYLIRLKKEEQTAG